MCKGKFFSQEDQGGKNSLTINSQKIDYLNWISYQESKKGVCKGKIASKRNITMQYCYKCYSDI
jgi:hypothetical protein